MIPFHGLDTNGHSRNWTMEPLGSSEKSVEGSYLMSFLAEKVEEDKIIAVQVALPRPTGSEKCNLWKYRQCTTNSQQCFYMIVLEYVGVTSILFH